MQYLIEITTTVSTYLHHREALREDEKKSYTDWEIRRVLSVVRVFKISSQYDLAPRGPPVRTCDVALVRY